MRAREMSSRVPSASWSIPSSPWGQVWWCQLQVSSQQGTPPRACQSTGKLAPVSESRPLIYQLVNHSWWSVSTLPCHQWWTVLSECGHCPQDTLRSPWRWCEWGQREEECPACPGLPPSWECSSRRDEWSGSPLNKQSPGQTNLNYLKSVNELEILL